MRLSPEAQAVLDAFHRELSPHNEPGGITAALRAAADQLDHATSAHTLYAIADELEVL